MTTEQLVGLFIALAGFMGFFLWRIERDIDTISRRMDASTNRTDKLYEMFVQLLKEIHAKQ